MAALTLARFREAKQAGFPGWETVVIVGQGVDPYVSPADLRYGEPAYPFGSDPAQSSQAFERWCAENLAGDYYVAAGPWTGLVYCQLRSDLARLQQSFGEPA
jgi:hypothetical protein